MELIFKVRNKRLANDPNFLKGWRDGQLIDIREDGVHDHSNFDKVNHCVIKTQHDFWKLRGSTDWKSTAAKVYELKKFLCAVDSGGKYAWELGAKEDEKRIRPRDWFVDFKMLLNLGWITQSDFETIYDVTKKHNPIYIDRDLTSYLVHEDQHTRLTSIYSDEVNKRFIAQDGAGAGTGGGFTIGAAGDYATATLFEAAIDAKLTGDLHGLHLDEETAIDAVVAFDTETDGHTLYLTAEVGAEHSGIFGNAIHQAGDGARISMASSDYFDLNETTDGHLDDAKISNLVLDSQGSNTGVTVTDGGNSGQLRVNRCIIKGDANSRRGIQIFSTGPNNVLLTNNIIYDIGNGAGEGGILNQVVASDAQVIEVYNNTCINNYENFVQDDDAPSADAYIFKNNLAQAGQNADWRDDGSGFGTTSKNISEDATSPDAAYQSKDVHTNSVFNNYAADNFLLDSDGDGTNLAIVDDGDDLSGTFTDDIEGQTRVTWYIGASEILAAGGLSIPVAQHHRRRH